MLSLYFEPRIGVLITLFPSLGFRQVELGKVDAQLTLEQHSLELCRSIYMGIFPNK